MGVDNTITMGSMLHSEKKQHRTKTENRELFTKN